MHFEWKNSLEKCLDVKEVQVCEMNRDVAKDSKDNQRLCLVKLGDIWTRAS